MAEVAVAASVAGLASLGLQCCKGLTTYYSSYKAYDEQIGATHEQIQALTALFEKLKRLLSSNSPSPVQVSRLQNVDKLLNSCRIRLQELDSVLQECRSTAMPSSKLASLRKIKSQALFPFKEQTLLTLRENVRSLRDDLKFALSILQTDLGMEQRESIANLAALAHNTRSDIQAIAAPVQRMSAGFERLLQQREDTTTRLSHLQAQTHQDHEVTLEFCRSIPEQFGLLLQQDRRSSHSLEQKLITARGQDGTERELLRDAIKSFDQKRDGEFQALATRMDALNESITKIRRTIDWALNSWNQPLTHSRAHYEILEEHALNATVALEIRNHLPAMHFVDQFVRQPSLELDPNVLSRLLNRLCNMGLELTSSNMTTIGSHWLARRGCFYVNRGSCGDRGDSHVFVFALSLYHFPPDHNLILASSNDHFEILKIVIRELALRQGDLTPGIAVLSILTRSEVARSKECQRSRSSAAHARTYLQSLDEGAPQFQGVLPGLRTVYHSQALKVEVANELWNAGFRGVDIPDEDHKTPLMIIGTSIDCLPPLICSPRPALTRLIESALWLHGKGASLHRPRYPSLKTVGTTVALPERRAVHLVTAAVKQRFVDAARGWARGNAEKSYRAALECLTDDLSLDTRQFLYKILLDTSLDGCVCACSRYGCMPTTIYLKREVHDYSEESDGLISVSFQAILSIEYEEASEFRDEDNEGIQFLETLLSEFEEKRGDENIKSFLDGYWSTRIGEVHAAREESVNRARIREIGALFARW
ncbi:MAG: hypothetical protein Q9226_003227 [Calogaya cf. arnoldii]